MLKRILIFIFILSLSNCSAPGSAFLGPIFTGAKSGSIYQASLSYGSNVIISDLKLKDTLKKIKDQKKIFNKSIYQDQVPTIIAAHKVDIIDISEVVEPEPLP